MTDKDKKKEAAEDLSQREWISHTEEDYRDVVGKLVHQSFKTTNSKSEAGGVRVPLSKAQNVPYIGISSFLHHGVHVPLEYTKNPGKATSAYKQVNAVASSSHEENAPEDEVEIIRCELSSVSDIPLVDCSHISPRLRQVLIPRGDTYISLTPISSHGVGQIIRSALWNHHERLSQEEIRNQDYAYLNTAELPIGGAKSLNVGMEVFGVRSPLVGDAPSPDHDLRYALSLFYRGSELWFPQPLVEKYIEWRDSVEGNVLSKSKHRESHAYWMNQFARFTLNLGDDLNEILFRYREHLPMSSSCEDEPGSMPYLKDKPFQQGLTNPALRDQSWKEIAAREIRSKVVLFQKDRFRKYEYSTSERKVMADLLKEAL